MIHEDGELTLELMDERGRMHAEEPMVCTHSFCSA